MVEHGKFCTVWTTRVARITAVAACTMALCVACAGAPLSPPDEFGGSNAELTADGHLLLASGGRHISVFLADYRLPKIGEPGFDELREGLKVTGRAPLSCKVQRREGEEVHAICAIEGRTSLAKVFRQWCVAESKQ